jgi:transcriptional regulator with XRE-family HTH domain
MDKHVFARRLKQLREAYPLTKRELAAKAGFKNASILTRYEKADIDSPGSDKVNRIAAALDVEPATLQNEAPIEPQAGFVRIEAKRLDALEARLSQLEGQVSPLLDTRAPARDEVAEAGEAEAWEIIDAEIERIGAFPVDSDAYDIDEDQAVAAGPQGGNGGHGEATVLRRRGRPVRYRVRVEGRCMEPEARDGDFVEFEAGQYPLPGDMVVVSYDGKAIVKYLDELDGVQWLLPLDGDPIQVVPGMTFVGVVKNVRHKPRSGPRMPR